MTSRIAWRVALFQAQGLQHLLEIGIVGASEVFGNGNPSNATGEPYFHTTLEQVLSA